MHGLIHTKKRYIRIMFIGWIIIYILKIETLQVVTLCINSTILDLYLQFSNKIAFYRQAKDSLLQRSLVTTKIAECGMQTFQDN